MKFPIGTPYLVCIRRKYCKKWHSKLADECDDLTTFCKTKYDTLPSSVRCLVPSKIVRLLYNMVICILHLNFCKLNRKYPYAHPVVCVCMLCAHPLFNCECCSFITIPFHIVGGHFGKMGQHCLNNFLLDCHATSYISAQQSMITVDGADQTDGGRGQARATRSTELSMTAPSPCRSRHHKLGQNDDVNGGVYRTDDDSIRGGLKWWERINWSNSWVDRASSSMIWLRHQISW